MEENSSVFQTLANQLSIAIDNAQLFESNLQTQAKLESQTQFLLLEGWKNYLNAVDMREVITVTYDHGEVKSTPLVIAQSKDNNKFISPLKVGNVDIGLIALDKDSSQHWAEEEYDLINEISNQVSQRVENLRLLNQAQQYRLEAEESTHLLTRQGWQTYLEETPGGEIAFVYDQNQVVPSESEITDPDSNAILQEKIIVRGEAVGEVVVNGIETVDESTQQIITNVTERLSSHLENLRLADQTRKALALSEQQAFSLSLLNELATQLSSAGSIIQVLQVSGQQTRRILNSERSSVALVTSEPDQVELYTVSEDDDEDLPVGKKMPMAGSLFGEVITQNRMVILPDDSPLLGSQFKDVQMDVEMGIQTIMSAPLVVSGRVVGSLNTSTKRSAFSENEQSIFNQVVLLVSNALENRNLLERTQSLAQHERSLRQITSRVRSYTDPETILRTAARELGAAVGRKVIVQLSISKRDESMQGWQEFQDAANLPAFFYDENSVLRINDAETATMLSSGAGNSSYQITPLALRGIDQIGLVGISNDPGKPLTEDDQVFIEQIAEQVALALESARLFTQTQRALAETDALYTIISELNAARDYNMILSVLAQRTILASADQSVVMFIFDHALGKDNVPDWIIPVAQHSATEIRLAERYPLNAFELNPNTLFTNAPVILEKVMEDGRLDRITQTLFHDVFHANSSIILPMLLGDQSLGFILGNFGESRTFTEAEIQRLATITSQVAIAVQGMQLLEQTLTRAKREQLLREVTNQVNTASGTDEILRRAAEQVGRALKRPVFVYLGNTPDRYLEKTGEEEYGNNSSPTN